MKKDKASQPIDDLFARKLSNLSLPPSADGFERLQARIKERDQKTTIVFWRNPTVQRYMAAAACLLLVCLFGWLYLSNNGRKESQIANKQTYHPKENKDHSVEGEDKETIAKTGQSNLSKENAIATIDKTTPGVTKAHPDKTHIARRESESQMAKSSVRSTPIDATETNQMSTQAHPNENDSKIDKTIINNSNAINPPTQERLAENTAKANIPTERVLVVTIEEPATLVAARQIKNSADEKVATSANESDSKEAKGNGIWQQVKRLKHGELFAQSDNATNNDQGLLSRAYTGLKQSFDKGKSTKQ